MAKEFIKELERLKAEQAEQGGFNTPESVAPGFQPQTPQELSAPEFGPTLDKEAPLDVLAPSVESPKGQVPMLGGFEVRGDGAERFALGTPEVPETLSSELYGDPGGNTAAIAGIEAERAKANAVEPSTPDEIIQKDVQETDKGLGKFRGDNKFKQPDWFQKPIDTVREEFKKGFEEFKPSLIEETIEPTTNPMGVTPEVMATPESIAGLSVNGTDVVTPEAITEAGIVVQAPNAQTMDSITGTGIDRLGLDPSVTAFGPVDPNVQTIQGVDETMNQQALLPEGLTASSPIPEGLVKAIGPDGKMILASPAEAARLNAIELQTQKDDRAVQQKFLASDKAREFSNRQIRSAIMGDGQYGRESLAREQRQADRPDFGEAQTRAAGTVTDRERRAARGEGMSDADRRDIAKGSARGASAGDVARAMKVAELNNVDVKTGESLNKKDTRRPDQVEQDRLNLIRTEQIIEDGNKTDATPNQKLAAERQVAVGKRIITQAQADEANKIDLIGKPTNTLYDTWAEWEAATGIDQDKDGKVSTKEDAKSGRLSKVDQSRLQELRNKDKK